MKLRYLLSIMMLAVIHISLEGAQRTTEASRKEYRKALLSKLLNRSYYITPERTLTADECNLVKNAQYYFITHNNTIEGFRDKKDLSTLCEKIRYSSHFKPDDIKTYLLTDTPTVDQHKSVGTKLKALLTQRTKQHEQRTAKDRIQELIAEKTIVTQRVEELQTTLTNQNKRIACIAALCQKYHFGENASSTIARQWGTQMRRILETR